MSAYSADAAQDGAVFDYDNPALSIGDHRVAGLADALADIGHVLAPVSAVDAQDAGGVPPYTPSACE